MKSIPIIVILLLFIFIFWQFNENQNLKKEVKAQRDSIDNYHFNKLTNNGKNYNSKFIDDINDKAKERRGLKKNDSILETHRITLYEGNLYRLARVDLKKDSSLDLTYKVFSARNPLTGHGEDSLYKVAHQKLDKAVWLKFKEQFAKISPYDLTYWNGYSDCWGGGFSWEATIGYKTYSFGTSCTQAREFTEACEIILRTIKDPEVVKYFKRRDE